MFNVTVLKMKDIKKYGIGLIAIILIMIMASKILPAIKENKRAMPKLLSRNASLECLDQAIPTIATINQEEKEVETEEKITKDSLLQGFLKTQISSMEGMEKAEEKLKIAKEKEEASKEEEEKIETDRNRIRNTSNNEQSHCRKL